MQFLHGLGGNHAVWFNQVPVFATHFTVVTMSQRGFAPSGGRLDRYDVGLLVDDLLAVLDACDVRRISIVGQSMGGWTALGLALRVPDRVRALILTDTVAGISDEQITANEARVLAVARSSGGAPPTLGRHPGLSPAFSEADPPHAYLFQTLSSFGTPNPAAISGQLSATHFDNALLARVRIPTLFVVGSSDTRFPPTVVRQASTHLHGSRVVEIPGAGHSPYFEQSKLWNEAVTTFLGGADIGTAAGAPSSK